MTNYLAEEDFRIPKTAAPIVCHTTWEETIVGEIFLDVVGKYRLRNIQEFFNSSASFFPVRTTQAPIPLLIAKSSVVVVECVSSGMQLMKDSSITLSGKKPVVFDLDSMGSLRCELLIHSPAYLSRSLDVLNLSGRFLPVIWNDGYTLINKRHIFRVVEL